MATKTTKTTKKEREYYRKYAAERRAKGEVFSITFSADEFAIVLQAVRLFARDEMHDDPFVRDAAQHLCEKLERKDP